MEAMFVQIFGGTNKEYKKVKLASLNLSNLAIRVSIDGYQKTLLDIILITSENYIDSGNC